MILLYTMSVSHNFWHIYVYVCFNVSQTHNINDELFVKYDCLSILLVSFIYFPCFCTDDNVQLLDLPDELILMIMNKVKPRVLLLCSIITIGNNRLEQLALDKCHSIDLTIDYFQSLPREFTEFRVLIYWESHSRVPDMGTSKNLSNYTDVGTALGTHSSMLTEQTLVWVPIAVCWLNKYLYGYPHL